MKRPFGFLLFPLLWCFGASSARADWQPSGVPVCTDGATQTNVATAPDDAGGMFVVWKDTRGASGNIYSVYAQHIDATGNALWTPDGVVVKLADIPTGFYMPGVVSDGAGGAIVFWTSPSGTQVKAQRLNAAGTLLWPASGVVIGNPAVFSGHLVSDGAGGAIVSYVGLNGIRLQRINASGSLVWTAGGVLVAIVAGGGALVRDGAGGVIVSINFYPSELNGDVFAQRVNSAGVPQWTAGGVPICTDPGQQNAAQLVSDGAGGAILAWFDARAAGAVYARRVNAAGTPLWTANGVNVGASDQLNLGIAADDAGGAIVLCGVGGVYAQRLNASGVPQWIGGGVPVCVAPEEQAGAVVVSDQSGGVMIAWQDRRDGPAANHYVYGQRLLQNGVPTWQADGIRVCPGSHPTPGGHYLPSVSADGAGGGLFAWVDYRTGAADIYATFTNGNTQAGTNVVVQPTDVNGTGSPITIFFDTAGDGSTTLAVDQNGPSLPGTFTAGDGNYYHITTTATHSGDIQVCIVYDENALSVPEASLKFLHWDTTLIPPAWVDITSDLNPTTNIVCGITQSLSPFVLAAPDEPSITAITDIGNDQGRQVNIRFAASGKDSPGSSTPIIRYEAYRRDDAPPALTVGSPVRDDGWTQVGEVAAHGQSSYGINAPTIGDSTITLGQYYSRFFIRAATVDPLVFFDSEVDSGYSLDNLAPGIPLNLTYATGDLSWNESEAEDFDYFTVYGSNTNSFGAATAIDYTVGPSMDVTASPYVFYFVTATDFAGNEGKPAGINTLSGVDEAPKHYILSVSAYPNPFNPETTIRYTVPSHGRIAVDIFDAHGARIRALEDRDRDAGAYSVTWDGRDSRGVAAASGIYFARLKSAGGERTYKLTLLK